jgi:hypothetical protein
MDMFRVERGSVVLPNVARFRHVCDHDVITGRLLEELDA